MAAKVKVDGKSPEDYDLVFVFRDVKLFVLVDPEAYSDEEARRIEEIVKTMSREITIDKSYVDFPENKHRGTFLQLDGWSNLCKLVKKTKFGRKSSDTADEVVTEAFRLMITAYMYDILERFGYDLEGISIDFIHGYGIDVVFCKDEHREWEKYIGPWQTWGKDSEQD